ncbi:MAG: cell division protein SepF [Eubacteriales bacterium]|nr:cell division protein SepF [Clostridiales bacterium]MDD6371428.1 cell division protein SepF [Eubacteriales bacterium]MDD7258681.1 cell division protein SepF [Eubacteriales bacterium]MDY6066936.1 cell division protein SepF [Candidatus Faecousia sp.]
MSLWDNVKKFAAPYSDDDYDDYDEDEEDTEDDYEEEEERPARRSAPARRSRAAAPVEDEPEEDEDSDFGFGSISTSGSGSSALGSSSGFNGPVLHTGSSANKQEVVLFRPGSFNDTSKAADDLRNRKAVIVNMENVDKAMARRVVDFLSGCVYALDGDVKKIAQSAYLFCPHNMEISGDLETLQAEVENYI